MVTANEESRDDEQLSEDEEQQEENTGQRFSRADVPALGDHVVTHFRLVYLYLYSSTKVEDGALRVSVKRNHFTASGAVLITSVVF